VGVGREGVKRGGSSNLCNKTFSAFHKSHAEVFHTSDSSKSSNCFNFSLILPFLIMFSLNPIDVLFFVSAVQPGGGGGDFLLPSSILDEVNEIFQFT
jgi:hypothetical protein